MIKKIILIAILLLPIISAKLVCVESGDCEATISISTNKDIYNNKEKISIYNNLSTSGEFIIEYWVENSSGGIIKNKLNTTNLNEKSFTPNLERPDRIKIKNKLISIDCNNKSSTIESEKEVAINVYQSEEKFLELVKAYTGSDNKVELNDSLKVKFNAYNGNSTDILYLNLENITSYITELKPEFTHFNFTENLEIPYNCSIVSNNYTLTLKAFDIEKSSKIEIINKCKNNTEPGKNSTNITTNTFFKSENNINFTGDAVTGRSIIESADVKFKEIGIYILIAVSVISSIYIIPKVTKNGISNKSNNRNNRFPRRPYKSSSFQRNG